MTPVDTILSGRYRVERMLGQGGMSDVFRAVDLTTGDAVAVKIVRSPDPDLARRLAQEAKALARFDHVGLVRLLDAGVHEDQAFLVMELVEGPTLAARLRRGPLSPARTAMLGGTLAGALAYVHSQGIVHRDVKPANVLLGPGPRVRLADFGIARLADASSLTVTGTTLGTAGYMAPEQLEHHTVGTGADIWSLGVILLECLTGRRVFEGTATEIVARRLAGPTLLPRDLPAPWRLLFEGMLAPLPEQRPSAAHVAGLLPATPFSEPWHREEAQTEALTETLAPGLGSTGNGQAVGTGGLSARRDHPAPDHDAGLGTLVVPAVASASTPPPEPGATPHLSRALWVLVAAVVLVAAGLSAWALVSRTSTPGTRHRSASTTVQTTSPTSSTSTTSTSTTTTPVPTKSSAAAALVRDAEAGVASGGLSSDARKSILDELNQALTASANNQSDQASSAISSMESTITNEVQAGSMTPAEASTLLADVSTLATALGVTASPTTTTTTSGGGRGHGNGN